MNDAPLRMVSCENGLAYKKTYETGSQNVPGPSTESGTFLFPARVCPAGVLFLSSVGGFSHSSREFTAWADCVNGANTLLNAVLKLAALTQP